MQLSARLSPSVALLALCTHFLKEYNNVQFFCDVRLHHKAGRKQCGGANFVMSAIGSLRINFMLFPSLVLVVFKSSGNVMRDFGSPSHPGVAGLPRQDTTPFVCYDDLQTAFPRRIEKKECSSCFASQKSGLHLLPTTHPPFRTDWFTAVSQFPFEPFHQFFCLLCCCFITLRMPLCCHLSDIQPP